MPVENDISTSKFYNKKRTYLCILDICNKTTDIKCCVKRIITLITHEN